MIEKRKNSDKARSDWDFIRVIGILFFAMGAIFLLLFYFDRMTIVDYLLYFMIIGVALAKQNKS